MCVSSISRLALPVSTDTKSVRDNPVYLWFLVVFVPCALLLLLLDMLQLRSPAFVTACLPWMRMSWLEMASPRLVRPLGVAAASSAALADRGWVRPGPVLAGAWPISAPSWLAAARPFSPAPGRSSPLLSDTSRGMRRPMATAACLPATEVRLALPPRHVRDVGSLLFNGRVYEHAAYMYVYETRETRTRSRTSPHATRRSRGHAGDNEAQSA
jgi:hypothetical protein